MPNAIDRPLPADAPWWPDRVMRGLLYVGAVALVVALVLTLGGLFIAFGGAVDATPVR
jgi:hypothetical protein